MSASLNLEVQNFILANPRYTTWPAEVAWQMVALRPPTCHKYSEFIQFLSTPEGDKVPIAIPSKKVFLKMYYSRSKRMKSVHKTRIHERRKYFNELPEQVKELIEDIASEPDCRKWGSGFLDKVVTMFRPESAEGLFLLEMPMASGKSMRIDIPDPRDRIKQEIFLDLPVALQDMAREVMKHSHTDEFPDSLLRNLITLRPLKFVGPYYFQMLLPTGDFRRIVIPDVSLAEIRLRNDEIRFVQGPPTDKKSLKDYLMRKSRLTKHPREWSFAFIQELGALIPPTFKMDQLYATKFNFSDGSRRLIFLKRCIQKQFDSKGWIKSKVVIKLATRDGQLMKYS